jgi:hypothetical protein
MPDDVYPGRESPVHNERCTPGLEVNPRPLLSAEEDSAAWSPDLRFDIKNPPSVSRGGLTIKVGEGVSPTLDANTK